ncbi:MAG: hypothetical protein QXI32_04835 [Candidatus Bathyarchaeia archaeon]
MWKRCCLPYGSSFIHVLLASSAGYMFSLDPYTPDLARLGYVLIFGVASKLFSILIYYNASRRVKILSLLPFLASISVLGRLNSQIFLGILVLALYASRPLFERVLLDVLHHVLRYVLIFVLASGFQSQVSTPYILAMSALVLFSIAGELLAGLRKHNVGGTVLFLGTRKSLILAALSIVTAIQFASLAFNSVFEFPIRVGELTIPFYILPSLGVAYVLTRPIFRALKGELFEVPTSIRKSELLVVVALSVITLATLYAGRTHIDEIFDSEFIHFSVKMRIVIAGKYSWNVPWILFDYINQSNYYYFLLHKDGILELGRVIQGRYEGYVALSDAHVDAFQTHQFKVFLDSTIRIVMDDKYELMAPRLWPNRTSRVRVISTIPSPWLAFIELNPDFQPLLTYNEGVSGARILGDSITGE